MLRPRAWVIVTTANPTFANDSGLADRLLVVRMERRDEDESRDEKISDEIRAARDAGLSHIAHTLCLALADTVPVESGINPRHPDFGEFAIRIGRALGKEAEAIVALQAAEADKASFCLENDSIASALISYLGQQGQFSGVAADLVPHLVSIDPELDGKLSAKRLGKRLSTLWPHLEKLVKAQKETNRIGVTVFTFKSGEAGGQPAPPGPKPVASQPGNFWEDDGV
jgi:hypothetical protein